MDENEKRFQPNEPWQGTGRSVASAPAPRPGGFTHRVPHDLIDPATGERRTVFIVGHRWAERDELRYVDEDAREYRRHPSILGLVEVDEGGSGA